VNLELAMYSSSTYVSASKEPLDSSINGVEELALGCMNMFSFGRKIIQTWLRMSGRGVTVWKSERKLERKSNSFSRRKVLFGWLPDWSDPLCWPKSIRIWSLQPLLNQYSKSKTRSGNDQESDRSALIFYSTSMRASPIKIIFYLSSWLHFQLEFLFWGKIG